MPEKKKIIRMLECRLLPTEISVKADRLAELDGEITALEKEAQSVAKRYRGQVEELKLERTSLSDAIRTRTETRPIECREAVDRLKSEVVLMRNDTDEEIHRRPMTYEEKQDSLFDKMESIDLPGDDD